MRRGPLTWQFLRYLWARFWDDRCFESAGALSYTTMFALVPLGAVGLAIVSAFPAFDRAKDALLDYAFAQFVPSAAGVVQDKLEEFFDRASLMTAPGILALIGSALLMMSSIEESFNRIWRAPTERPFLSRFVVFWTALTLGPVLIAGSLAVSAYIASLPLIDRTAAQLGLDTNVAHWRALPMVIELLAFTLSYAIIPHRSVRWRHALAGGILAMLLFEVAKSGFAWYVRSFPATTEIYGALAAVPIFMLWLYILWLIVLLGAEFAAALGSFRFEADAEPLPPTEHLALALRVLGHLRAAQRIGDAVHANALKTAIPGLTDDLLQRFLADFSQLKLVDRTELGGWVLVRDLAQIRVLDLYRTGHYPLPTAPPGLEGESDWERALAQRIGRLGAGTARLLDASLAELLEPPAPAAVAPSA